MSGRIFFKVDVLAIRDSHLISKIGADGWVTLCSIAAFMDEQGVCYPTQGLLKITMEDGSPLLERSWKVHGLTKRSIYRINKACGVLMGRELNAD